MNLKILLFSFITTVCFACTSGGSNSNKYILEDQNIANESVNTNSEKPISDSLEIVTNNKQEQPSQIKFGDDYLIIHGKDIWVRDEPAIGKVVMKLNEGDKCIVWKKGFFEIIRGDADYWYEIEINGKRGWVFGAQTNYRNKQQPILATASNTLWNSFKQSKKNWIEQQNKKFEAQGEKYVYSDNATNLKAFTVIWEGEGPSSFDYSLNSLSNNNLCLISEAASLEGTMGYLNQWSTYIGVKIGNSYSMYADGMNAFDGKAEYIFELSEDEYVLFTYQDSGDKIVMTHRSYYNIFYINNAKHTVRKINSELALLERNENLYKSKGGYAIVSASIEFLANSVSFNTKEVRYEIKETDEGDSYAPYDTLTTNYAWNAKSKMYINK